MRAARWLGLAVGLALAALGGCSSLPLWMVAQGQSQITDYRHFDNAPLARAAQPQPWHMLMAIVRQQLRQQLRHLGDGQRAALEAEHGRITHIAHDAVGEMVEKRLRNRQSLLMGWREGEGANIETYVSRVALNLLRNMAKRAELRHRGRVPLSDTSEGDEAGGAQALPAQDEAEADTGDPAQEQMRFIADAVRHMDGVAALVMQELYQGLTETAAAAKSGLSRSTYKRRNAEVVARLRGLWAGDSGPAGG